MPKYRVVLSVHANWAELGTSVDVDAPDPASAREAALEQVAVEDLMIIKADLDGFEVIDVVEA